jgi:hypothetical protein
MHVCATWRCPVPRGRRTRSQHLTEPNNASAGHRARSSASDDARHTSGMRLVATEPQRKPRHYVEVTIGAHFDRAALLRSRPALSGPDPRLQGREIVRRHPTHRVGTARWHGWGVRRGGLPSSGQAGVMVREDWNTRGTAMR